MQYTARGEHNRHFELLDNEGNSLGRLDYDGWFSVKVELETGGITYRLGPSNFWGTIFQVLKSDEVVAEIKRNWWNNIIIDITGGASYVFKQGFWPDKFTLYTEHEMPIVVLKSAFKWAKLSFSYEIETDDNYTETNDPLLLLILIYCCNHAHKQMATAGV